MPYWATGGEPSVTLCALGIKMTGRSAIFGAVIVTAIVTSLIWYRLTARGVVNEGARVVPNSAPPAVSADNRGGALPPPEDELQASLVRHSVEPKDEEWANGITPIFRKDLAKLATANRFVIEGADCRSTSCVADLSWDSVSQYIKDARVIASHIFGINCRRSITPKQTASLGGRFHASMILDCQEERAKAREK